MYPIGLLSVCANQAVAVMPPANPPLPNFDKRAEAAAGQVVSPEQRRAVEQLQARQPRTQVEFDPITGGPKSIWSGRAFLSWKQWRGRNDPGCDGVQIRSQ